MRSRLANELAETINEFGPKLYEDFNEVSAQRNLKTSVIDFDQCSFASWYLPQLPRRLRASLVSGAARAAVVLSMLRGIYSCTRWYVTSAHAINFCL